MTRSHRNEIASASWAICVTSIGTFFCLIFAYLYSRPIKPDLEHGFVNALNNHGSYVYISDTESTGLGLLVLMFFAAFSATLAIVPKTPILPSPGTPRWLTYVSGAAKIDLNFTPRLKTIFVSAVALYLLAMWLVGPALARLVVAQGVVLHV